MNEGMIFILECISMVLIMVAILGSLYIKLFVVNELDRLRDKTSHLSSEVEQLKAKQRVYEKRLHQAAHPEHIVFHCAPPQKKNEVEFGGF